MQVDVTFNINKLKMCLIIVIDITNISKTFFITQSYAVFESKEAFNYFFFLLNQKVFNDYLPLWVIITNQGRGIITSLSTSMLLTTHQFCAWYAVKNIKGVIVKSWNYESDTWKALYELTWSYIRLPTYDDLIVNWSTFLKHFKVTEQVYICQQWVPKKEKVILCCTCWNLNLRTTVTFRSEGFHPVFKAVMNPQQQLQASTEFMQRVLYLWYRNVTDLKTLSCEYRSALID